LSALTATTPGRIAISGPMTFATVAELRRDGRRALRAGGDDMVFDLAGVAQADSAGLALLVDWLAWSAAHGRKLRFENLPDSMRALATISAVLPLVTAAR
jgi:phospholipid transport system transporter-binding protein